MATLDRGIRPEIIEMAESVNALNYETVATDLVAFGTRRSDTSAGEAASE